MNELPKENPVTVQPVDGQRPKLLNGHPVAAQEAPAAEKAKETVA